MAYRKTEKVIAGLEAKRNLIIASAIDVIAKSGIDGLTTDAVCERAGIAVGLIYKYFPDKTELLATVIQQLLDRDLAAIRAAAVGETDPLQALSAALMVFFNRLDNPRLVKAMADAPAYRLGIRAEFERMIRSTIEISARDATIAAAGALGAIYGIHDMNAPSKKLAPQAVQFALRGIGISGAAARKAIQQHSMATAM